MRWLVVALLFVSLGASSFADASEPPKDVAIIYVMEFTGPNTAAGTWSATGAIADAGSVTETFTVTPTAPARVAHITRVLTGSRGTLTLRSTVHLVSSSAGIAVYEGPWHVQSATATYAGLTGGGTFIGHLDVTGAPTFVVNEMEGMVHSR